MVTAPLWPEWFLLLRAHLEAAYPSEGCGLVLRGPKGIRARIMANAYDRYHARDPEHFPRTSRTAYLFDPREWLGVSESADESSERVIAIVHSHVDVGAYFSAEDLLSAAPEGEPLLPGVHYLVVAINSGRATDAKSFSWQQAEFREVVPAFAIFQF